MSILESIRNRASLFIVLFVGFALLAFILQGSLDSGFSFFGQGRDFLAEINGHKVKQPDFDLEVQKVEANLLAAAAQQGRSSLDPQERENVLTQVWNKFLDDYMYQEQYSKLGIDVSNEEVLDMLWGYNVVPQIQQSFRDSITGQFSPALVHKYVEGLDENAEGPAAIQYNQLIDFENSLKVTRKRQKYYNLVNKGFYVPAAEVKRKFEFSNKNAIIKYVTKRYDAIPDSTIKVTEEDIRKAYDDNKFRFRTLVGRRKLDVVTFDIIPSQKDIDDARKSIEALIPKFKEAKSDTAFVYGNTDNKKVDPFSLYIKGQTVLPYDTAIQSATAGTVLGPFVENASYKIIKVVSKSDSVQVKARHILFSINNYSLPQAKAKADSVKKAIKAGADFATMARQFSNDGSAQKGGDLGFFKRGQMVKPFNDACFNGNVGDMPIVETQFGVHIIEIQQKEYPVTLAAIEKEITAGEATIDSAFVKATEFASTNNTGELFDKAAKAKKLNVRPYQLIDGAKEVQGMQNSGKLVIWANDVAEKGNVSEAIQLDGKYVVACLKEIRTKGITPFEDAKADAEILAKQAAKAKKYVAEFTTALSGATTIDQVAAKLPGTVVESASVQFNSSYIARAGNEQVLIGTITTTKPGTLTKVITGQSGVYIAFVESVNDIQPAKDVNMKMIQKQFISDLKNRGDQNLIKAIENNAEIVDKRYRFY